jgi:hypothetical protein
MASKKTRRTRIRSETSHSAQICEGCWVGFLICLDSMVIIYYMGNST